MSCYFSRFHCGAHVAGETIVALPDPLILIFSQIGLSYMILFHLCTYLWCAGSNEGLGASCWALVCGFQHDFHPFF